VDIDNMAFVHEYKRLARQGFVPPLTHSCGEEYTVVARGDQIRFHCYHCDLEAELGMADIKAMGARIDDYYAKRAK
jgi:hypothetical protein